MNPPLKKIAGAAASHLTPTPAGKARTGRTKSEDELRRQLRTALIAL